MVMVIRTTMTSIATEFLITSTLTTMVMVARRWKKILTVTATLVMTMLMVTAFRPIWTRTTN